MRDNKPYLLSTQPLSKWLMDKAAGKGVTLHGLSFIETKPIQLPELEIRIGMLCKLTINAVFTSIQAVEKVIAELAGQKPNWRIFCTRPASSKALATYFGTDAISAVGISAAELANKIIDKGNIADVVFFCGRQRRNELPGKLSQHGIGVQEVLVYESKATPHSISRHYDGISFFSPGAVHSFFSFNPAPNDTVFFAIGKTTADTIALYSGNKVIISETPDKELLIEKAIDYFQIKIIQQPGNSSD